MDEFLTRCHQAVLDGDASAAAAPRALESLAGGANGN